MCIATVLILIHLFSRNFFVIFFNFIGLKWSTTKIFSDLAVLALSGYCLLLKKKKYIHSVCIARKCINCYLYLFFHALFLKACLYKDQSTGDWLLLTVIIAHQINIKHATPSLAKVLFSPWVVCFSSFCVTLSEALLYKTDSYFRALNILHTVFIPHSKCVQHFTPCSHWLVWFKLCMHYCVW